MDTKIRIRIGAIEIEYEGSEAFLKQELPTLLTAVASLHGDAPIKNEHAPPKHATKTGSALEGTTGSFAAKLGVKRGTELILAASAHLTLVENKARFSRQELVTEMQSANAYYKKTYLNNLTGYLNTLIKDGKLLEPSNGSYSLSAVAVQNLKSSLS